MQLIEHGLCGGLRPSERGELPVLLPGHRQEGITPIHEVTRDEGVRVRGTAHRRVAHCRRLEQDHEEHLKRRGREGGREGEGGEGEGEGEGEGQSKGNEMKIGESTST